MSAHLKAQALRFVRTSGYAFIAALLATGGNLRWWDLLTLLAGATETGLRQLMQVEPKPTVTSVLAGPLPTTDPAPPSAKG